MNITFIHAINQIVRKRTKREMEVFTYEIQKSIPKKAARKYTNKTYFLKEMLSFAHIFYIAFSQSFIHFQ